MREQLCALVAAVLGPGLERALGTHSYPAWMLPSDTVAKAKQGVSGVFRFVWLLCCVLPAVSFANPLEVYWGLAASGGLYVEFMQDTTKQEQRLFSSVLAAAASHHLHHLQCLRAWQAP